MATLRMATTSNGAIAHFADSVEPTGVGVVLDNFIDCRRAYGTAPYKVEAGLLDTNQSIVDGVLIWVSGPMSQ